MLMTGAWLVPQGRGDAGSAVVVWLGRALEGDSCPRGIRCRAFLPAPDAMNRVWRLLGSLKLRVIGPEKLHVGVDHLGNKYYRIPKHETWAGHIIQERRFVEAVNRKEYEYAVGDIPAEWEAWMRKKRKDPPTIEEILENEKYREVLKRKVDEYYEKDRLLQAKEYEEGLVAEPAQIKIKGHASSQHYGRHEPSEEPVSTANTFQPGSWKPSQDHEHKK